MKDLHIKIDNNLHRDLMVKVKELNTTASAVIRLWIEKFLRGEEA